MPKFPDLNKVPKSWYVLTKEDIKKIKAISSELLETIKQRIDQINSWKDKPSTRSEVKMLILNYLYQNLPDPTYVEEEINSYVDKVYQYVYYHFPPMVA